MKCIQCILASIVVMLACVSTAAAYDASSCTTSISASGMRTNDAVDVAILVTTDADRSSVLLRGTIIAPASTVPLISVNGCPVIDVQAAPCSDDSMWCLDIVIDLEACSTCSLRVSWVQSDTAVAGIGVWTLSDETGTVLADAPPLEL